jgi:UDP-glucose 4-epimerase
MQIRNKRVLVTGGAGFIGSNLVDALIARGNTVTVLDDFSTGHRENLKSAAATGKATIVEGSIMDYPLCERLVREADVVFHLAVQCLRLSFTDPVLVHEVNATGSLNLLRACIPEGKIPCSGTGNPSHIEKFIYVSSSEVYGSAITAPMSEDHELNPTTVYGASKLAGELYTRAYQTSWELPTVILRPFNSYGYREHWEGASGEVIPRFAALIMNGMPPIIFGDGEQTRDFTFVTDTVEGMILAAESDALVGQAVNIARGEEISIKGIAERLLATLDKKDLSIEWHSERPGDVRRHYADVALLTKATGFRPSTGIDQGIGKFVEWFTTEFKNPAVLVKEVAERNWERN